MASETPFVKEQENPPSYTSAEANRPKDAPPSYYDVMGIKQLTNDIGAAKEEANNPAVMIFKVCCVCIGSLICTSIVFVLFGAIPISLLVVGAVHIGDCELDERIPKWMVVYGSVSLAYSLINIFKSICCPNKRRQDREVTTSDSKTSSPVNSCANSIEGILTTFLFVWLIIGSVWVIGKYDDWDGAGRPNCDDGGPNYDKCCHEGTFLFAFIFIITMWSLGFLILCCACSCICLILACVKTAAS